MTPREVHIAIDLGLQKLGSFAYDNIKPEFIDMVFNRMGDAYITEKTTAPLDPRQLGFEQTQSRLATIRELVTETSLTTYHQTVGESLFSIVPNNFFSFIEAKASIIYSCNNSAVTYSNIPAYIQVVSLPFSASNFLVSSSPFDDIFILKIIDGVGVEIFNADTYPTIVNITDRDEVFTVKNIIMDYINGSGDIKVYSETFDGSFYSNSLVFVSTNAAYTGQRLLINYTDGQSNVERTFTTTTYSTPSIGTGDHFATKTSFCRLLSNEETYHMLAHPFGTTSSDSPIINIVGDRIISYVNERFILKGLTLKYIRKPRRMSLSLNQSYELQDSRAISKIIDMTVEYLSATIESQGLQALTIQNQQRD